MRSSQHQYDGNETQQAQWTASTSEPFESFYLTLRVKYDITAVPPALWDSRPLLSKDQTTQTRLTRKAQPPNSSRSKILPPILPIHYQSTGTPFATICNITLRDLDKMRTAATYQLILQSPPPPSPIDQSPRTSFATICNILLRNLECFRVVHGFGKASI